MMCRCIVCFVFLLVGMPSLSVVEASDDAPPNVVLIICDDLNNAMDRMGRRPCAAAPNLQRLMNSGVRFTSAYSNCPICLPSRNSMLSGLYAHRTGHYQLSDRWRQIPQLRDAVMLPKHMLDNGYGVFGAGKVHHNGAGGQAWWTEFHGGADYGPFPWNGVENFASLPPSQQPLVDSQEIVAFSERYRGVEGSFMKSGKQPFPWENGFAPLSDVPIWQPDPDRGIPGYRGWRNQDGSPFRYVDDADRDRLPDEKSTDWAVAVLGRKHDKPFFLALGYLRPHTPFYVPKRYFDMFPPDQLELPPQKQGDLDDCAAAHVGHRPYGLLRYQIVQQQDEMLYRRWLQAYLACIAFVDDQVGKLLDALDNSPYRDNTIVIFTSDNGYHMGEKEFLFKDTLWEEGCAVPLIVRAPGLATPGSVCQTPVSLIDVYPTLVDLCSLPENPNGVQEGKALDGKSLKQLLVDPDDEQEAKTRAALSSVRGCTGVHHSLRTAKYRYILCEDGGEELYDLTTDRNEWTNLVGRKQWVDVKQRMRRQLQAIIQE